MEHSDRIAGSKPASGPTPSILARISLWLVGGVLVCSPLPLGSVGPVSVAVWAVVLAIALLCALVVPLRPAQLSVLGPSLLLALVYSFVLHEQISTASWFNFAPNPIWAQSDKLLGAGEPGVVAVARYQPLFSSGLAIVSFLSLTTSLMLAGDPKAARWLIRLVGISGAIYAGLAIVTFAIEPSSVLFFYEKSAHAGALTSPFVNRNTAAVYYGTCGLVWLSLFCEAIERRLPERSLSWSRFRRSVGAIPGRDAFPMLAGWFICLVAMFLTGSRAGAGISLAAMVGVAVSAFWERFLGKQRLFLMAGALLIAILLFHLLGGGVGGRFSSQGLSDEGRLSTYRATVRMLTDYPWLGTGIGTFEWLYPSYRTDDISMAGIWDRAHDSWLELAAAGGLLMAGSVIALLLTFTCILAIGIRTRRRDKMLPIVGLYALTIAVLHSTVDFSLQIPAYAIVISVILGCAVAQSFRSQRARLPQALKLGPGR